MYRHRIYKLKITPKRHRLLIRFTINKDKMFIRNALHLIGRKRILIKDFILPAKDPNVQVMGFNLKEAKNACD